MSYDETAYIVFLEALCDGLTIDAAAGRADLSPRTIDGRRRRDPDFAELVNKALRVTGTPESVRRNTRGRSTFLTTRARTAITDALRRGATLREAADEVGIPPLAVKRYRYADPAFDAAVVEAGTAAGRSFKRLVKPPCPGPKCGTAYGYDTLGCREAACRQRKVSAITSRRKQ